MAGPFDDQEDPNPTGALVPLDQMPMFQAKPRPPQPDQVQGGDDVAGGAGGAGQPAASPQQAPQGDTPAASPAVGQKVPDPKQGVISRLFQGQKMVDAPTAQKGTAEMESQTAVATAGASLAGAVVRAPLVLVTGAGDFAWDVGAAGGRALKPYVDRDPTAKAVINTLYPAASEVSKVYFDRDRDGQSDAQRDLTLKDSVGSWGYDWLNQGGAETIAVLAGAKKFYAIADNLFSFSGKASKAAAGVVTSGAATGSLLDPDSGRLASFVKENGWADNVPLLSAYIDYAGGDDKDGMFEKRFKNVLDDMFVGGAAEALFSAFRSLKNGDGGKALEKAGVIDTRVSPELGATYSSGAATVDDAVMQNLDDATLNNSSLQAEADRLAGKPAAQAAPQDPAAAITAPPSAQSAAPSPPAAGAIDEASIPGASPSVSGQSQGPTPDPAVLPTSQADPGGTALPSGSTPSSAASASEKPAGGTEPAGVSPPLPPARGAMVQRVNKLLASVGVPQQLDETSLTITTQGKIVVEPEAYAALQQAGLGRPFTSVKEAADAGAVVFKASTPDGTRIVGSMSRESLAALKANVEAIKAAGDRAIPRTGAAAKQAGKVRLPDFHDADQVGFTLRAILEEVGHAKEVITDEALGKVVAGVIRETGLDAGTVARYMDRITRETGEAAYAAALIRTAWVTSAKAIDEVVTTNLDSAADEAIEDIGRRIYNMVALGREFTKSKSSAGRTLRIFGLPTLDNYIASLMGDGIDWAPKAGPGWSPSRAPSNKEAAGNPNATGSSADTLNQQRRGKRAPLPQGQQPALPRTRQEMKDWLDMWAVTKEDPKARQKYLEGTTTALPGPVTYVRNALANSFTASILSAPRTLALNWVAPSLLSVVRTVEKSTGSFTNALLNPNLAPRDRMLALAQATDSAKAYMTTVTHMGDVAKWAIKALKEGKTQLGGGGAIVDSRFDTGPISPNTRNAARTVLGSGNMQVFGSNTLADGAYALGNGLNWFPRQFNKINSGMDEFAKRLAYLGEARLDAMTRGRTQGLKGQQLATFVSDEMDRFADSTSLPQNDPLLRTAERTTMTGKVGAEGGVMRTLTNAINQARKDLPELRYILPVFSVPANGMGETIRRLPGLNMLLKESGEELMGKRGLAMQNEALGRTIMGTALLGTGFAWARAGLITGEGPTDPKDRAIWTRTHQPWSLNVGKMFGGDDAGDEWVRFDRYDVLGSVLAVSASLFDQSVKRSEDREMHELALAGAVSIGTFFKDRAALQTISDFMNMDQFGPDAGGKKLEKIAAQIAGRIAIPNWVSAMGREPTDQFQREKGDFWKTIMDMVPGGSQTLPAQYDIFGEAIVRPNNSLMEGIFPVTHVAVANDKTNQELDRLYQITGYYPGAKAADDLSGGFFNPNEVTLEDGSSLYAEYMRMRDDTKVRGQTLKEAVGDLVKSPKYRRGVDAPADRKEMGDGKDSRGYMLREVFQEYDGEIKKRLARKSDQAARWMAVSQIKARNSDRLRGTSAEQLAENPDLMVALGINPKRYETRIKRGQK